MIVIILAGGRGERLNSITEYVPKSLIPINNVPIIERQIKYLQKFNITKFVIALGYLSQQVINYIRHKNYFYADIEFSIEKTLLGTGGAIKNIIDDKNENSYIIMNGDIITNMDISLLQSQIDSVAIIPLITKFGVVCINDNRITQFDEKKIVSNKWMNSGLYHLSKKLLNKLPTNGNIEQTLFPMCAKQNLLYALKYQNIMWHSIDSYKDINECEIKLSSI